MRIFVFFLTLAFPFQLVAQDIQHTKESQTIDNHYFQLENNGGYHTTFKSVKLGSTDTFSFVIDSVMNSTGNPKEEVHLLFTDAKNGFIYGNEVGYGVWPFLFKTSNGGRHWERILIKARQYGPMILKDNFYMFDKKRGILMYNVDNFIEDLGKRRQYLKYYITEDGGKTWKQRKKMLKHSRGLRIENNENFMSCSFSPDGDIKIKILRAPWASQPDNRVRLLLTSNDFGKHFEEQLPK